MHNDAHVICVCVYRLACVNLAELMPVPARMIAPVSVPGYRMRACVSLFQDPGQRAYACELNAEV